MGLGEDPSTRTPEDTPTGAYPFPGVDPWPGAVELHPGGVGPTPPAVRLLATYRIGDAERSIEISWEADYPTPDTIVHLIKVLGADARKDEEVIVTGDVPVPDDWATG